MDEHPTTQTKLTFITIDTSKERIGSKVKKKYDKAKTPAQRILDFPDSDESIQ